MILRGIARANALARRTARVLFAAVAIAGAATAALAADPIKIGFSMGLTGANGPNGKQLLVALEIWRDDINAKGGLLGRPVELVYYDDQTSPTNEAPIYTKLINIDKVDLVLGPYGTNMIAAALPILAQRNLTTIGILGTAANHEVQYKNYFSMISLGEDPIREFSRGFFEVAMAQNPKPQTVAIVGADAEFGKNSTDGARINAKAAGLKIVYDQRYPPTTADLTPVVRAIKALNPDIVYVASYPTDTVLFVRAAAEAGLSAKMMGGAMIGLLATPLKMQMGPLMNGYVNNAEMFVPAPSFNFPGVDAVLKEYQKRAKGQGIDPFGYGFVPYGYATGQVLAQAVEGTKSLDHAKIGDYMRTQNFSTVVGDIRFGKNGEWAKPRSIMTQWRNLTASSLDQLNNLNNWAIVWPPEHKSADIIYPYQKQ
ncbi:MULTISPECIES: amino acid ABC transporter substrate-binding protein [unclassified Beijerinckia]|uniref:amino acid ABC transporter substrate-binding protein n=1 Tax=unclassified Beijerinckia TaxID=2638183 RepID=UPI00089A0390|nr:MULTISPECIES: amino acid ABC transporter substrate-binding protein [unclassified Beijerinckia]MDH7796060.1 branched-chain amino acid transport system substrate-binding protein [Beijerinckia sp. GAS462]SEC28507.1 amino acid/amide ABC transporter substrate-binding protein, HAAT family [Beijerinckia sp. 28-YEA-48]